MEEACGRQENWSLLGFPILLSFFPAALLCDNKYSISIDGLVLYYVCCVFVTGLILTALSFFFFSQCNLLYILQWFSLDCVLLLSLHMLLFEISIYLYV